MGWSGFKPGGEGEFPYLSRLAPRSTQPPVQWIMGVFTGVKGVGHGINHPPLLVLKLKKV